MDPHFAFEVYKRREIELTRRLELQRVARERIGAIHGTPREGWRSPVQLWWKASLGGRVARPSPVPCCATAAAAC